MRPRAVVVRRCPVPAPATVPALLPYLAAVPDPRKPRGRRHPLPAILALASAALLAARLGFTRERTPRVATLHRVFRAIDAAAFERAAGAWAAAAEAALAPPPASDRPAPPRGVAVDGKALRGSTAAGVPAVRLLGALGHDLGLVLAQAPVPAATDEAGALPDLLAELVVAGRVPTLDAAFAARGVAAAIGEKGGAP